MSREILRIIGRRRTREFPLSLSPGQGPPSTVTDGTNTSTLSTITYDGDNSNFTAAPGITAHDSAYTCNYGQTGCTTAYRGNPTTILQPGKTTGMWHDIAGNVVTSKTNGVTTTPTVSSSTNYSVPSAITTGSFTTNLGFNSFLGLTNETGPNGDSLGIGYDAAARPATTTSPYGAVTGFTYNDTASPPTHIAITNGHGTRTTLDGFGRTIKVETGTGTPTNFTVVSTVDSVYGSCGCSPLGKLTQTSMPYAPGGTEVYTTYTYDGMGRTLTQTAPDGSVTTYAYAGNSVSVTDPAGKWKQYYMDTLGNVSMVVEPNPVANPTSPPGWAFSPSLSNITYHVTNYSYDVLNHLTQVSMPRYNASTQVTTTQTRTFNYAVGTTVGSLLLSATNPENGTVTYTYNTNNQIATKTDAKNQQTQLTYDSYNRVTEVQHFYYQSGSYVEDSSQRVNYTYDSGTYGQGRLTGITYQPMANSLVSSTLPTFSESCTYTQPGSVASKQLSIAQSGYSGLSLTGSWMYDSEGKMTSLTYPSVSNHSGTYTTGYDSMARPSTLVDNSNNTWASNVAYGPSNEPLSLNNENRTYNSRLQLTSVVVTVGGVAQFSQLYMYPTNGTNNGKAIQQNDVVSGEQVVYQYDSLNRLSAANTNSNSSTTWGQGFVYDGFGNLYQKNVTQGSAPSLSVTANAATNQISGYGYDSNGNTTYMPGSSPLYMSYDVENRMASATQNSTPQVLYAYDASNRRVWKGTVNNSGVITAQEMYYYGADGKKLGTYVAQFGSPGQWVATDLQVHFGGRRVAHWAGSVINSQVILVSTTLDRVGSVRNAGSNGTGSGFYPYGEDKGTAAPNDQTKFATYTRDSATGLDYAMNRYYSNTLGRFMSPDPYVAAGASSGSVSNPSDPESWDRYAYTRSDPVNRRDPNGTCDEEDEESDCGVINPAIIIWAPGGATYGFSLPYGAMLQWWRALFTQKLRLATVSDLASLSAGCKSAINADLAAKPTPTGVTSLADIAQTASSTQYYNAAGGDATTLAASVTGNPNYLGMTLSQTLGTNVAVTLVGVQGQVLNDVVVGSFFLNGTPYQQAITLIHEALHTGTGLNDQDLAGLLGLGTFMGTAAQQVSAASQAITLWLADGCAPPK